MEKKLKLTVPKVWACVIGGGIGGMLFSWPGAVVLAGLALYFWPEEMNITMPSVELPAEKGKSNDTGHK